MHLDRNPLAITEIVDVDVAALLQWIGEQQRAVALDDLGLVLRTADLEQVRTEVALRFPGPDERHDAREDDDGDDHARRGAEDHHPSPVRVVSSKTHRIQRAVARSTRRSRSPGNASFRAVMTARRMAAGSGSGTTLSTIPSCRRWPLVSLSRAASSGALPASRSRMAAAPSGAITENTACCCINSRSAWAIASAPPLPPSPTQTLTLVVGSSAIAANVRAISPAMPSASEVAPGSAPGVSTKVSSGNEGRPARAMARWAVR